MGLVFQDPMTRLNPLMTVGGHLLDTFAAHRPAMGHQERTDRAKHLLEQVAKAAAKVTGVLKPSLVTSGSTTALTAAVRATGASPTGLVDVYYRGKRVRTGMVLVDGKVRTTFRPTVVGRHAVRIVYRGSNGVTAGETTLHLRVR